MKKKTANPDHYEFIWAIVDCDGELGLKYKLPGKPSARMDHDTYVDHWEDKDIQKLARSLLSVEKDDPVVVEVMHE